MVTEEMHYFNPKIYFVKVLLFIALLDIKFLFYILSNNISYFSIFFGSLWQKPLF